MMSKLYFPNWNISHSLALEGAGATPPAPGAATMIPPPTDELLPRDAVMLLVPLELHKSPRLESKLLSITLLLLDPERALRLLLLPPDLPLPPLSIQEERRPGCQSNSVLETKRTS